LADGRSEPQKSITIGMTCGETATADRKLYNRLVIAKVADAKRKKNGAPFFHKCPRHKGTDLRQEGKEYPLLL